MFKPYLVAIGLITLAIGSVFAAGVDFEAKFKKGSELLEPFLVLNDRGSSDPSTPQARAQILQGIQLLSEVTVARPDNWAAYWLIGKGHQSLRDHSKAEIALKHAYEINSDNADVAREFMIESICSGHFAAAVNVAEATVKSNPKSAGLIANLGLAYLANGQLTQARAAIMQAQSLDPADRITRALLIEIEAVQSGRKPSQYCPP